MPEAFFSFRNRETDPVVGKHRPNGLLHLLPLLGLIFFASTGTSQTPPWYFINTGIANSHIILFLDTIPMTIDGNPLSPGDYVGAFYYDEFGNLKCGTGTGNTGDIGGMRWEGVTSAAATWGTEPNVYNGFQTGELLKWRVWRASDGSQFEATLTYLIDPVMFPDSGFYVPNGISAVASLAAFSIPGMDLSVNKMLSPVSGCNLPDSAQVTILIENHDSIPVTGFYLSISINGNDTLHALYTDILAPHATDTFTFEPWYDFSQTGFYSFYLKVTASGDVNASNDAKYPIIENRALPVVNIGNDTTFCPDRWTRFYPSPVYPVMSWSDGSSDTTLLVQTAGTFYLTVTDNLGCLGVDSVTVGIFAPPDFDLGPDTSFCIGRYILLEYNFGFPTYLWSNGTTASSLYTSNPGTFVLTVTDIHGCPGSDTLHISESPIPVVNLGINHYAFYPDTLLDAGPGFDTYLWQDGTTTQTYSVTEFGLYAVTVSENGCTGIDDIRIIPRDSGTVVETLRIFPNPGWNNQIVTIEFPNPGTAFLDVYDPFGRHILTDQIESRQKVMFDPTGLAPGLYFVRIMAGNQHFSLAWVKI